MGTVMIDDIQRQSLELRIRMLEKEFKATNPLDSLMRTMLQLELEIAYKTYMNSLTIESMYYANC